MNEETIASLITWGIGCGLMIGGAMGLEGIAPSFNSDRGCEMAIASVSAGTLTCGDRSWSVRGSKFTPRGTFPIEPVEVRTDVRLDRSPSPVLPFNRQALSDTPIDSPSYELSRRNIEKGMTESLAAIHEDNIGVGAISAGCLLASPIDLAEMVKILPGAYLMVED